MEAIVAAGSFVVLFGAWVILPSQIKKRHEKNKGFEETDE